MDEAELIELLRDIQRNFHGRVQYSKGTFVAADMEQLLSWAIDEVLNRRQRDKLRAQA